MKKGVPASPEFRKKISESVKRKIKLDPGYRKRISEGTKKAMSDPRVIEKLKAGMLETRHLVSGENHWTRHKEYPESAKKKIHDKLVGIPISRIHKPDCQCTYCPNRLPATPEINYKKGNAFRGKKRPPMSEEQKEKIRIARRHQKMVYRNTKIEIALQECLRKNGIIFELDSALLGQPDIFIQPNICIFADGCYWHSCPRCELSDHNTVRDTYVNEQLTKHGYVVIRFYEHEIKNNVDLCVETIKKYL